MNESVSSSDSQVSLASPASQASLASPAPASFSVVQSNIVNDIGGGQPIDLNSEIDFSDLDALVNVTLMSLDAISPAREPEKPTRTNEPTK